MVVNPSDPTLRTTQHPRYIRPMFVSAYKQLRPAQKAYVDNYVSRAERDAERRHERISLALHRPVTAEAIEASDGMLDLPMVRAAIAERINEIAANEEFTWQRWLKEVSSIAFSNVNDFQEVLPDGTTRIDLTSATPEAMAAIKSIETEDIGGEYSPTKKRKVKLHLHDKIAALKMMGEFYERVMETAPHLMQPPRNVTPGAEQGVLPAGVSVEQAQDAYAKMIEG